MKLQRVLFESVVYDPMSKGAENKRSFFTSDQYDIDYDTQNGYVQVSAKGQSVCVPFVRVKEFRLAASTEAVAHKTKVEQISPGVWSVVPATPKEPEPEPEPVPVKTKKPRRAAASAASDVVM